MTVPPPHPPTTATSGNSTLSSTRSNVWGVNQPQQPRRDISPILTSFNSSLPRPGSSTGGSSQNPLPSHNPWSPAVANPTSSNHVGVRQNNQSPSLASPLSGVTAPPGLQQSLSTSLLTGGRPRTTAATASLQAANGGGGPNSSGASSKNFRGSPSLSQPSYTSPTTPSIPGQPGAGQSGSLSKIVITQLFLLLSTIKDDKDSPRWDSEAEKIRKVSLFPEYQSIFQAC